MRTLTTTLTLVAALATVPYTQASTKVWKGTSLQGWTETYIESKDGGQFNVDCNDGGTSGMTYRLTQGGKEYVNKAVRGLTLQVDDHPPVDVTDDGSRDAATRIYTALGQIRYGTTLTVRIGDVHSTYSLKKAHDVIPSVGQGCTVKRDSIKY